LKAADYQSADVRRVHDDKCNQAGNRKGSDQLKEATEQEWTEVHSAKNKKTVSGVPEDLTVAIRAHASP
jgi:hypothetical protein